MECPTDCKYALKESPQPGRLELKNYSESIAEQQELLNLYLEQWIKTPNPLFDNKTPAVIAKTSDGKKKLLEFLDTYEPQNSMLTYNHAREILDLPLSKNKSTTYEDVATKFLEMLANYDYEDTISLLVNPRVYKDEAYRTNYIKRNMAIKAFKALRNFDLIRSALSSDRKQAIVEFEINSLYTLSVVLKKVDNKWSIAEKVFDEAGVVLAENDLIQKIVYAFAQQKFKDAYSELHHAIRIYPDSANMNYYVGVYWATQGKVDEAKQYFFNAMELDPDFIEAQYNYAFVSQAEGNIEKAKELYEEILKKKEEHKTLNNLAVIYESEGAYEEAEVLLKRALELKPDFELAQKNLERIQSRKAQPSEE
jgi:tetratricopeptide (TPR) repeat protein